MNLDDALSIWRTQNDTPNFEVKREALLLDLQREDERVLRQLKRERLLTYGMSILIIGGLSFIFLLMAHDDDPRSVWDFVAAGMAVAAIGIWGVTAFISEWRLRKQVGSYATTLQEELNRNLALVRFKLSIFGGAKKALVQSAPFLVGITLLFLLIIRINNQPFGFAQLWPLLVTLPVMILITYHTGRSARADLLSRKEKLEELARDLA